MKLNRSVVAFALCVTSALIAQAQNTAVPAEKPLTVQQEFRLPGENGVKGVVTFSPDGKTLMVCRLRSVHFWDLAGAEPRDAGAIQASTLGVRDIICAAFSPDGTMVALGGYDKGVHLYAFHDMQLKEISNQMEHDAAVRSLQFSPDGTMLASGGDDMALYLWDVADHQLKQHSMFKVEHAMFGVQHIDFSPDGRTVLVNTGTGDVRQVNIASVEPTEDAAWKEPSALEMPIALSPDGTTVAVGSKEDVILRKGGKDLACHGHTGQVHSLAWDSDGRTCTSCGEDGRLMVWDLSGGIRFAVQRPSPFDSVAFRPLTIQSAPHEMWIAAANRNGTVYLMKLGAPVPAVKPSHVERTPA